jgi:choline dehydrogenase
MTGMKIAAAPEQDTHTAGFAEQVRANQQKLTAELKPHYDFIVCGSGSSGSVVARRPWLFPLARARACAKAQKFMASWE